jgi:hypothetical protein
MGCIYSDLGTALYFLFAIHCCTVFITIDKLFAIHINTSTTTTQSRFYQPYHHNVQKTLTTPNSLNMAPSNTNKMWKKRYLIPLWIVQLIVLAIYFVLSIVGMSAAEDLDDYLDSPGWNRSEYSDQVVYVLLLLRDSRPYSQQRT